MKKILSFATFLLFTASVLTAQTALNNDSIIKMAKAGLSDDVIVATVNASAGGYNTTPDSLITLKKSGVSDKVIAALIQKGQAAPANASDPANSPVMQPTTGTLPPPPAQQSKPRVYLSAQNSANTWGALVHNQAQEMSKDFGGGTCPTVIVTVNEQNADYTVSLNHVESGLFRDNQLSASDRNGDVIAPPLELNNSSAYCANKLPTVQ